MIGSFARQWVKFLPIALTAGAFVFVGLLTGCRRELFELQADGTLKPLPREVFESPHEIVEVTRVVSGNEIEVSSGKTIRYISVDAPLAGDRHFQDSRRANEELVFGKKVKLLYDQKRRGGGGKDLCYVLIPLYQGEDSRRLSESSCTVANYAMIRSGSARFQDASPNRRYRGWLRAAELRAREQRLGIWRK